MNRTMIQNVNPERRVIGNGSEVADVFGQFDKIFFGPAARYVGRPDQARQFDRGAFDRSPIDLYETGDSVVLQLAVPGFKREQLDVSLEGRQLTIAGKSEQPNDGEVEERSYWLRNLPRQEFSHVVKVPAGIDPEGVAATVEDGILTVSMPKATEAKARKIDIQ